MDQPRESTRRIPDPNCPDCRGTGEVLVPEFGEMGDCPTCIVPQYGTAPTESAS